MPHDRPQGRLVFHSFRYVKAGDTVRRILGRATVELRVTEVDEEFIYCGRPGVGWKFDRATGIEVDEEIGWGPQFGVAGSYLIHPHEVPPGTVDLATSGGPATQALPDEDDQAARDE